jgi:hypothetical protein
VVFDDKTFLLTRTRASALAEQPQAQSPTVTAGATPGQFVLEPPPTLGQPTPTTDGQVRLSLRGKIPPEQWNKIGTKLLPKLRTADSALSLGLDASITISARDVHHVEAEIRQALRDLGLEGLVGIEKTTIRVAS